MSCSLNSKLEEIKGLRDKAFEEVAAIEAQFEQLKNDIENGIQTTIDNTIGTALAGIEAAVNDFKANLPQLTSLQSDLLLLIQDSSVDRIQAFVAKWGNVGVANEVVQGLLNDPINYLLNVDPCKDVPNIKLDETTNTVKVEPPQVQPTTEIPEEQTALEPSVMESENEISTKEKIDLTESNYRERLSVYTKTLNDAVIDPFKDEKKAIAGQIKAKEAEDGYIEIVSSASQKQLNPSDYIKSEFVTESQVTFWREYISLKTDFAAVSRKLLLVAQYINAYEKFLTFGTKAEIPPSIDTSVIEKVQEIMNENKEIAIAYYRYRNNIL